MPLSARISQVMTTDVKTIDVDERISAVRDILRREGFHHVPVVDGGELVGIISSRDLLRVYRGAAAAGDDGSQADPPVAETMQTDLVTMRHDEKVERAIDALADGAIHSLLVVDKEDRLVGIVTNIDLLEYLFE